MKYKTTAKEVRNNYNVLTVGYCDMQSLLRNRSPESYTSGVYGWNFDVYNVSDILPNTVICTGYRGMPKSDYGLDYSVIREAELAARSGDAEAELKKLLLSAKRGK